MIPFRRSGYECSGRTPAADLATEAASSESDVQQVETVQTGETNSRKAGVGASRLRRDGPRWTLTKDARFDGMGDRDEFAGDCRTREGRRSPVSPDLDSPAGMTDPCRTESRFMHRALSQGLTPGFFPANFGRCIPEVRRKTTGGVHSRGHFLKVTSRASFTDWASRAAKHAPVVQEDDARVFVFHVAVDSDDIDAVLPQGLKDILELPLLHGEIAIDQRMVIGAVERGPCIDAHLFSGDAVAGHLGGAAEGGLVHAVLGLAFAPKAASSGAAVMAILSANGS